MKSVTLFIVWCSLILLPCPLQAGYYFASGGGGGGGSLPSTNLVMDLDPDSLALSDGANANGTWQDSSSEFVLAAVRMRKVP